MIGAARPTASVAASRAVRRSPRRGTTLRGADRVAATIDQLNTGVRALADSDAYRSYLRAMGRFHRYSAGNVLLILQQRPDATHVAGYRAWQELGRQVCKGERGIRILAPVTRKAEGDDGEPEYRCVGFRAVCVFDVAQTDGEPLPEGPAQPLQGAAPADAYARLAAIAESEGLTVADADLPQPVGGRLIPSAKRIELATWADDAQRVKTLAHELAHHFTGSGCDRADGEIVAESVAYVVSDSLGLDTSAYSLGYVLGWADGDVERVKGLLNDVQRVAHRLLN